LTREQVDLMLSSYREKAARCEHLEKEIPELENMLKDCMTSIIDDEVKTTSVLSDMPKGSITSDPTGRLGMLLAEGYKPERVRELELEIYQKKIELQSISPCVIFVDAWLSGLNPRERFLIERKVIDSSYWRNVIDDYTEKFGETYSKQGLRNVLMAALEKIYRIAA